MKKGVILFAILSFFLLLNLMADKEEPKKGTKYIIVLVRCSRWPNSMKKVIADDTAYLMV